MSKTKIAKLRISRVKMKNGGADLRILPPPKKRPHIYDFKCGTVALQSTDKVMTYERALWLIKATEREIIKDMEG